MRLTLDLGAGEVAVLIDSLKTATHWETVRCAQELEGRPSIRLLQLRGALAQARAEGARHGVVLDSDTL